ncbi:MAG TPA: hypothetical protein DHW71_06180 [Gammaproteobacteria bacterium]|nr:hypothetical protein [Gammaproteobacteria bacterium]HCK92553.1 hypothetical protein [Gammaproteobacteria bacterium]
MTFTARSFHSKSQTLASDSISGFTLIELLFVVTIIGIVMAVGTAAYGNYSKQINDEYGKILVEDVIAREKAYYIHNRTYSLSPQALGYPAGALRSEQDFFEIAIRVCNGDTITRCVEVTARPLTESTTGTTFVRDTRGNRSPLDEW